jgi:two-component sensor histidine kinase
MPDAGSAGPTAIDAVTEANHRIGNHLATIVGFAQKEAERLEAGAEIVRREEAVATIRGLAGKIAAVSTLHRALAANPERTDMDLAQVLGETLQPLKQLYGDRLRFAMSIAPGCTVESGQGYVLALAFAEILTNAMKYAHPTGLPVEISVVGAATAGGATTLEIADDGVGLPEGFDPQRDSGVGMKMMRYMIESAGGEVRTTSDELGLSVSITLPPRRDG